VRIAQVSTVACATPPPKSGSVQLMTSILAEGLVAAGHDVTLFATGNSTTKARLHATFPHGYWEDEEMWPWELYEMLNLAAAVERAGEFDVIHYQAAYYPMSLAFTRLSPAPIVQTLHHAPRDSELALYRRYPDARFVAISDEQARRLSGLNVVGTVRHGIDTGAFPFEPRSGDYLLFLGRFTEGKGVLQAIEVARRAGLPLKLAAAADPYYDAVVKPHVDGERVEYVGEVDHAGKVRLLGGAKALLYPVRDAEPFGLVLVEAMACGTPVAALDRGAVREVVDEGVTGAIFRTVDEMTAGLARVFALDRGRVRDRAVARFGAARMVNEYLAVYQQVVERHRDERAHPRP
jgi:glycosyltransferase involved in cell wall biosynthesis